jgi:hypothetical protein
MCTGSPSRYMGRQRDGPVVLVVLIVLFACLLACHRSFSILGILNKENGHLIVRLQTRSPHNPTPPMQCPEQSISRHCSICDKIRYTKIKGCVRYLKKLQRNSGLISHFCPTAVSEIVRLQELTFTIVITGADGLRADPESAA